jgi:hypothetical protein
MSGSEPPLYSIALSGVIAAVVAAGVNYFMNLKVLGKKDKNRMTEEKLRAYAFVIYHINEMQFKYDAYSGTTGEGGYAYTISGKNRDGGKVKNEWDLLVEAIDNKLKERPELVNPQIHRKWVEVKTSFFKPESKKAVSELREALANEGNEIRRKHFKHIEGDIISAFSLVEPTTDASKTSSSSS